MNEKTINGAIIDSILGKFGIYFVQIISIVLLSRFFSPEVFGIVASIQVFLMFFQLFSDFGIAPALINEQTITPDERNGIFSFTIILGLVIGFLFYFFSYFLNYYYNSEGYETLGLVVSISIVFTCWSVVPLSALMIDLKLIKLAKIEAFSHLLSLIITLIVYKFSSGVLALASKVTTYAFFRMLFIMVSCKNTSMGFPKLSIRIMYIKKIINFSTYQFGFNFINYFARNLDAILIAKYLGNTSLGIYDRAYQLMRYPVMLTTGAFSGAIQPAINRVGLNNKEIIDFHNHLSAKLLIISIPLAIFTFMNASSIVYVVLGEQWKSVIPLIKVLSISLPVQIVLSTSGSFFQVINKPKLLFITGSIGSLIFVTAISISMFYADVIYTSIAVTISFIVNSVFVYYLLFYKGFNDKLNTFTSEIIGVFKILIPSSIAFILIELYIKKYKFYFYDSDIIILCQSLLLIVLCFSYKLSYIVKMMKKSI